MGDGKKKEESLTDRLFKAKHGKRQEELEDRLKLQESEIEELRKTLEFKPARMVLVRLLVRAGLFRDPFNTNALIMARDAGYQQFGKELMLDIARVSPKHRNQVTGEYYDYTSSRAGNTTK